VYVCVSVCMCMYVYVSVCVYVCVCVCMHTGLYCLCRESKSFLLRLWFCLVIVCSIGFPIFKTVTTQPAGPSGRAV
jgi:type IV secretory pathway VirB3-like protein